MKQVMKIIKVNSIVVFAMVIIGLSCSYKPSVSNISDGNEKCDTLLSKKIKNSDLKADTDKLLECGLDSTDLPLAGLIIVKKMQNKAEFDTLTYRCLIATIKELRERHQK